MNRRQSDYPEIAELIVAFFIHISSQINEDVERVAFLPALKKIKKNFPSDPHGPLGRLYIAITDPRLFEDHDDIHDLLFKKYMSNYLDSEKPLLERLYALDRDNTCTISPEQRNPFWEINCPTPDICNAIITAENRLLAMSAQ